MADWLQPFKAFSGSFTEPPVAQITSLDRIQPAGITQPDALSLKDNSALQGNRFIALRDTTDLVDLSVSNQARNGRYMELERLRNMVEIETALAIYADECCVSGDTKVYTPFGKIKIKQLAQEKQPDELFLVYCYDFKKKDYTLGWAFHPRLVKRAETVQVIFSNGRKVVLTPDHRILKTDGTWCMAGDLQFGDETMQFNRVQPFVSMKKLTQNRFPRIKSARFGWQTEKLLVAEWEAGGVPQEFIREHQITQGLTKGMSLQEVADSIGIHVRGLREQVRNKNISLQEIRRLNDTYPDKLRVAKVIPHDVMDVYDLSVQEHENFCTNGGIMHNCQLGENGRCLEIHTANKDVKRLCERLCHEDLEMDDALWGSHRNLCLYGDEFWELVIDPTSPKDGILKVQSLPAATMYRIETIRGKLLEFQQSGTGADIQALANPDLAQSTSGAIRFTPQQIVHFRLGGDRRMFYPYGESILESAKSAAHQLRLMEDAMTVYRLTRSPSRRIFYIDVGQMPPAKQESAIERVMAQFRKKKVFNNRTASGLNSSGVEERWNPVSFDEDFWIPLKTGDNTRIDTLNEGVSWNQIDDILYFRNKLLIALGLPKSYLAQEDPALTRLNLSSQDIRFAKRIERHQMVVAQGIRQLCKRHLELLGFPAHEFSDLRIKITPSSDWREISRNEVTEARFNRASAIKGAGLMSDYDILVEVLKIEPEKSKELVSRLKMQKLDEMKLAAMAANPRFLGLAEESPTNEIGTEAGGPMTDLSPESGAEAQGQGQEMGQESQGEQNPQQGQMSLLPEPSDDDIVKYNMHISNYAREMDSEDIDAGELNEDNQS